MEHYSSKTENYHKKMGRKIMTTRSLFGWQGGKFYESQTIQPLIPKHRWYCEVFAGSLVTLINKPIADKEFANDKFSSLISFWECIKKSRLARRLMNLCEQVLDSTFLYKEYMKTPPESLNIVDRAYRFLYLSTFGFNSYFDTYYTPLTHKIDKIKNHIQQFRNTGKRLWGVHERIKDVMFSNFDFRECLQKIKPHKEKFLLLDPPYYHTHQYNRGYGADLNFPEEWYVDMRRLLEEHHRGGTMWMITCDQGNPYFQDMDDTIVRYVERRTCMNKNKEREPVRTEIIMNYDVNEVGSCYDDLMKGSGSAIEI